MLPGEQGLDFLMRAMEMVPSTRRILITGYTSPEFIARSMALAGLSACLRQAGPRLGDRGRHQGGAFLAGRLPRAGAPARSQERRGGAAGRLRSPASAPW